MNMNIFDVLYGIGLIFLFSVLCFGIFKQLLLEFFHWHRIYPVTIPVHTAEIFHIT